MKLTKSELLDKINYLSLGSLKQIYLSRENFEKLRSLLNDSIALNERHIKIVQERDDNITSLNSEINKLKEVKPEKDLRKEFEEKLNRISQEKQEIAESLSRLKQQYGSLITEKNKTEDNFKKFLISEHFNSKENLKSKDLQFLLELFNEKKQLTEPDEAGNQEEVEDSEEFSQLDTEEYTRSEKCICGKSKHYGAKGCKECKLKADRLRKRRGISMEEAWRELGIPEEINSN